MKRVIAILLAAVVILTLTACAGGNAAAVSSGNTGSAQDTEEERDVPDTEPSNSSVSEPTNTPEQEMAEGKTLVAFFSATGNTKDVAQKLADGLDADIYEIIPEIPYTEADLNYGNADSRATKEQNDPNSRPAISGSVENMAQYEVVFIGYPIWWGEAPRIISTFIESYDLDRKTLVPFCTSGSSGFGSSDSALKEAAGSAIWLDGKRFSAGASSKEVMEWASGLDINITSNNKEPANKKSSPK